MSVNWQELLTTVSSTGVIVSAVAYLVKEVLIHRLSRESDAFKTHLQSTSDAEIERLKNTLQMTALEHQVRFSKLHERRAEVIAESYKRLVEDVVWAGQNFISTGAFKGNEQEREEEFNKTLTHFRNFTEYIEGHRIYLPENICALLDKFVDDLREIVVPVGVWSNIPFPNEETRKEQVDAVKNAFDAFQKGIPLARRALEEEFRAMLGEPTHEHADKLAAK